MITMVGTNETTEHEARPAESKPSPMAQSESSSDLICQVHAASSEALVSVPDPPRDVGSEESSGLLREGSLEPASEVSTTLRHPPKVSFEALSSSPRGRTLIRGNTPSRLKISKV